MYRRLRTASEFNVNDVFFWQGTIYRVDSKTWDGDEQAMTVTAIATYWPNGRGAGTDATWVATNQIHKFNSYCTVSAALEEPTNE